MAPHHPVTWYLLCVKDQQVEDSLADSGASAQCSAPAVDTAHLTTYHLPVYLSGPSCEPLFPSVNYGLSSMVQAFTWLLDSPALLSNPDSRSTSTTRYWQGSDSLSYQYRPSAHSWKLLNFVLAFFFKKMCSFYKPYIHIYIDTLPCDLWYES